jgi:hypothetical protein
MSLDELSRDLRGAEPATADDVTILLDGRRIDSKEKVLEWLAEIEDDRKAGRRALDDLP